MVSLGFSDGLDLCSKSVGLPCAVCSALRTTAPIEGWSQEENKSVQRKCRLIVMSEAGGALKGDTRSEESHGCREKNVSMFAG